MNKIPHRIMMWMAVAFSLAILSVPAQAQQTGSVSGQVTGSDGTAAGGVTIVATSPGLPQSRSTTSASNGRYRLPLLPPGNYEITFTSSDGGVQTRSVAVLLQQKSEVDVAFGGQIEELIVVGSRGLVDTARAALKNSLGADVLEGVPTGQEYRDLQKLIPGVMYSEDSVRGPSAGGSGQDNNYQFDGVDVSLPMFGTLSAEPSSHDIAQISVVRGGATAIGFNRSGGYLMNTLSKSGTDEFHGEVSYKMQSSGMIGERKTGDSPVDFDEDKRWLTASLGGPILQDRLYFYGSYYRPTASRSNESNAYGAVPDYSSKRNEFFGKLTFAPTDNILLDASYRTSARENRNDGVAAYEAASTSSGYDASQDIAIVEGSWIVDDDSSMSFKYTSYKNETSSRPDTLFDLGISEGDSLNIAALAEQGYLRVPELRAGEDAYNTFVQPIINQYGYLDGGVPTGGGAVGGGTTIDDQDFSRESFEVGYDRQFYFGDSVHDVHIGYQHQVIDEDLARLSNGWGAISVLGGRIMADDGVTPVFFEARLNQMSLGGTGISPLINSRAKLQSFEINDTIDLGNNMTINAGVLVSNDILYGQGLRNVTGNLSGFELSPGTRYKMYETDWSDMIQPRLGINWDYSDRSSIYINYARYHPSASSLARAASWARNSRRDVYVKFDANGDYIETANVRSSSGKLFQEDMDPRKIDEFLIGWTSSVSANLTLRAHGRYRKGANFWEDTWNWDRMRGTAPAGVPEEPYIPNWAALQGEVGSGSSYVIAQLDNAYTEYYEVSLEAEWNTENFFVNASYTWSHYYGNFDQDNTTTDNDGNYFIGSSNIADGVGRQLWDFKEGHLRGDRRHILKVFGYYSFDWNGQAGFYLNYQSGQPWEAWDSEVYREWTGSTSDTIRYAEPAGSRRTKGHLQFDLNYTQNVTVYGNYTIQVRADLYNVLNSQTGYDIQSKVNSAGFGDPRSFYNPRRIQLTAKARF